MNSRDLSLIIIVAVLQLTIMLITNQITSLVYMIGLSYVFTIFYAINASVAWLMYEGRRWRILAQAILANTLISLLIPSRTIPLAIAGIVHAFTADLIFNSFYGYFESRNRLLWLTRTRSAPRKRRIPTLRHSARMPPERLRCYMPISPTRST